ncbi:MAG: exopolyphosphatase [Oscillospiraceae bacterium]|nr:exopolyphosphatase [Oscillospiraceae bacterium]
MRLVTRSDFDGLACGALLLDAGIINNYTFVHPKDLQDGSFTVTADDVLANVPFVEGCGLWFDHHSSEVERNAAKGNFKGQCREAPSCARIIYEYYGGKEKFSTYFDELIEAVDKVDAGQLTKEEIMNPTGWVLIGFLMDPRTGLGRFRDFTISNLQLMKNLLRACRGMTTEQILDLPDIVERIEVYEDHTEKFKSLVKEFTVVEKDVIITDIRDIDRPIYTGNRFLIYSLFPEQNISVWISPAKGEAGQSEKGCSVAVGHSILNRTSKVDVGSLMLKYGGGGHQMVGTCQFAGEDVDEKLPKLLEEIINYSTFNAAKDRMRRSVTDDGDKNYMMFNNITMED